MTSTHATRQHRIEGICTTRWYPTTRQAWAAYVRASIRRGASDPWHMPGDVNGDAHDPAGRAIHGVRDGHATVTLRWRVDPVVSAAAAMLGRKGGAAHTQAQAEAGRRNGRLGGRPRRVSDTDTPPR